MRPRDETPRCSKCDKILEFISVDGRTYEVCFNRRCSHYEKMHVVPRRVQKKVKRPSNKK